MPTGRNLSLSPVQGVFHRSNTPRVLKYFLKEPTTLDPACSDELLNQNPAHRFGGGSEEMGTVLPLLQPARGHSRPIAPFFQPRHSWRWVTRQQSSATTKSPEPSLGTQPTQRVTARSSLVTCRCSMSSVGRLPGSAGSSKERESLPARLGMSSPTAMSPRMATVSRRHS